MVTGPSMVHFNGSVNLPDAETVMRTLVAGVPAVARMTDGETGERKQFLSFLLERFQNAEGLMPAPPQTGGRPTLWETPRVMLAPGVDPADIKWPDLGIYDFYVESWATFQKLEREGVISPNVRLQCQLATPMTAISGYVTRDDALKVLGSYERALFGELDRLLTHIPHDRIAVQWDAPLEIGVLELPEVFAVADNQSIEDLAPHLALCIDAVPPHIPTGLHLCYGDAGHEHWKDPASLRTQVDLLNAVAARASRPITWTSFTVTQHADTPEFFSPLRDLDASLAEPYLALVPYHPEVQAPGTTERQVELVQKYLGERPWGVCTECGLSGVTPAELPRILEIYSDILRRFGPATVPE